MEDFKKALEGTLGRKHIDNIVDQVASFPDRFDALYTLTQHEETRIAWRATWACEKLSFLLPSLLMDKRGGTDYGPCNAPTMEQDACY